MIQYEQLSLQEKLKITNIITTEERHGKLFRSLNYTIVNSQLPSFEFIDSKNNWMIMPWHGGNIAHSIEVSNYLIHYFIHPYIPQSITPNLSISLDRDYISTKVSQQSI